MSELIDRSVMKKLALPRAFLQDMLLPFRGAPGSSYHSSWGEEHDDRKKRFQATLVVYADGFAPSPRTLKRRKDGKERAARKRHAGIGPAHADMLVALTLLQQAHIDGTDLSNISFQMLWRAMHAFRPCKNYSGSWRRKGTDSLDGLSQCTLTLVDRGPASGPERYAEPLVISGPLLRVFWKDQRCKVAGRSINTRAIDRVVWGPAIQHMLDEDLVMNFRADEYFSIRCGAGRIAYLFAPAPAAARARDTKPHPDGRPPADFSQESTKLLLKLGYSPDELSDRYRRHRLLLPLQQALDRRSLANGNLCVTVIRHSPPNRARHDWRLSLRVLNRRASHASPVEDVTFIAAQEGGRSRSELHHALRQLPELEHRELEAIKDIWPGKRQNHAIAWARKAKGLMLPDDRPVFSEILSEVRMLRQTGFRFRKAPAAMAVGLTHQLMRLHEWPLPQRRRETGPP